MIILRYSTDKNPEEVREIFQTIKNNTKEQVLVLPTDWDILFNCSTADLYYFKEQIEEIIRIKKLVEY